MKQIIWIVLGVCAVMGLLYCVFTLSKKSETLSAVYHGHKQKVNDEERLISLIESYANIGTDRLSDQALSDAATKTFKKSGLHISLRYAKGKHLPVSGYNETKNVKALYILEKDARQWLIVYLEDTRIVFSLKSPEIAALKAYIQPTEEGL